MVWGRLHDSIRIGTRKGRLPHFNVCFKFFVAFVCTFFHLKHLTWIPDMAACPASPYDSLLLHPLLLQTSLVFTRPDLLMTRIPQLDQESTWMSEASSTDQACSTPQRVLTQPVARCCPPSTSPQLRVNTTGDPAPDAESLIHVLFSNPTAFRSGITASLAVRSG